MVKRLKLYLQDGTLSITGITSVAISLYFGKKDILFTCRSSGQLLGYEFKEHEEQASFNDHFLSGFFQEFIYRDLFMLKSMERVSFHGRSVKRVPFYDRSLKRESFSTQRSVKRV